MININEIIKFTKEDDYNKKTVLCEIMAKYESDKSIYTEVYGGWHNYTPLYDKLFSKFRSQNVNFFEVGIYKGASIRAFKEYFINANIHAADIDLGTIYDDSEINFHICDQDNSDSISNMWNNIDTYFDIIIDDGKHEYFSNLNFLVNSIHKLKKGGIYIIEDLRTSDVLRRFEEERDSIMSQLNVDVFEIITIENKNNNIDNNIILIIK